MIERARCVECGEITPVKKDGKLWKHYDANNDPCSSLEGTLVEATDVVFAQKGQSLEPEKVEKCQNCPENAENCSVSDENCQKSAKKAEKVENSVFEAEKVENSEKLAQNRENSVFEAENSPKSQKLAEKAGNSVFEAEKVENSPKSAENRENSVFRLTIPVKAPCPYLEDTKWHQANKALAEKKAQKEGKTPSGSAKFEESRLSDDGRTLNLFYVVPIK